VTLRCVKPLASITSKSDLLQLILAKLVSIKTSNKALKQALVQQKAQRQKDLSQHQNNLVTLQRQFKERFAVIEQSTSRPKKKVTFETKDSPALEITQKSGSSSSPSQTTPPSTQTPSKSVPVKSNHLPDPPAFNSKRKDLPAFIHKLQYKLEGNADQFPTKRSQLLYAHSRLNQDVVALIDPLIDTNISNVDQFVAFLEATYGDPNKEMTALSKLSNLKQGKRSFTTHFAKFQQLAANTGLNKIGLITSLRHSLSLKLQRAMVGEALPNNLNTYTNLITTYNNNMRFLPVAASAPYRPQTTLISQRDPDAMEIDSSYTPVGSKERENRKKKGLCFKCSKHGHISQDCSVPLPAARSNSIHSPTHSQRGSNSSSAHSSPHRSRRSRSRSRRSSRKGLSRR
jgi:hypothetical protein